MKKRSLGYSVAAVTILVLSYVLISRPFAGYIPEKKSNQHLRVCAANIYFNNQKSGEVSRRLLSTKSDIFVISEWQGKNLQLEIFRKNGYTTPLNVSRSGTHGMLLLARKELGVQAQLIESPVQGPCRMPMATARLLFHSSKLVLLGIHVPPPVPACENTTVPTLRAIRGWVENGELIKSVGLGSIGDKAILAGDFNAHSFDKEVGDFSASGLADTYAAVNSTYGPTWSPSPWFPSIFRIDYIFAPSMFEVISSHTVSLPGSDHRAVVSDIKIEVTHQEEDN